MTQTKAASIWLSYEELVYLLRVMEMPDLPGMEKKPWDELTEPQAAVLFESVGRSLVSRGLVGLSPENTLIIDKALEAMLHASVRPERMLMISTQKQDQYRQYWFYQVKEFSVCQQMVMPWIYQFEFSEETQWGWETIEELIEHCPENGQEVIFNLPVDVFEQFRLVAGEDTEAAALMLMKTNISSEAAYQFSQAVAAADVRMLLQYTIQISPSIKQDALTLLATQESCWVLNSLLATGQIAIARVGKEQLRRILKAAHSQLK